MDMAIGFGIGMLAGVAVGAAMMWLVVRAARKQDAEHAQATQDQLRETFGAMAVEALDANSKRLGEQTAATLESKKLLIDQTVANVNERLNKLGVDLNRREAEYKQSFGSLTQSVGSLGQMTGELHNVLASTQRRGAWGERMAEDILQLSGLVEKVNYTKQSGADAESGRPDFTFMLPGDMKVNMDVKLPLETYRAYLDAESDDDRAVRLKMLVTALKTHVRAVAGRGYIDPKVPTVDYVILFVASEQILSLGLAAEPDLVDEALGKKVVLAGPMSLYAMLSMIRQVAQHASIMETADEVIGLLAAFNKQWQAYREQMDKLGQRIDQLHREYDTLASTRTNMLNRPLEKIEDLRTQRGIDMPD
jgi:DNA recombination protein RmuC